MSEDFEYVNDDVENDSECESYCCDHKKTAETVGSLTKWVSSLEDKVSECTTQIELLQEQISTQSDTLNTIKSMLHALTEKVDCRKRLREATHCNRQLGVALSAKLFKSEAKRTKTNPPPHNTIHPSVEPFLVDESDTQ
jgi:uncharacterized coiled-coil protein SlyX